MSTVNRVQNVNTLSRKRGTYRLDEAPRSLRVCSDNFGSNYSARRVIDTLLVDLKGEQGRREDAQTFDEL